MTCDELKLRLLEVSWGEFYDSILYGPYYGSYDMGRVTYTLLLNIELHIICISYAAYVLDALKIFWFIISFVLKESDRIAFRNEITITVICLFRQKCSMNSKSIQQDGSDINDVPNLLILKFKTWIIFANDKVYWQFNDIIKILHNTIQSLNFR